MVITLVLLMLWALPNGIELCGCNIIDLKSKVIGSTLVLLNHTLCSTEECNVANFINDAMVDDRVSRSEPGAWTAASIAATNAGGFQGSIIETDNAGVMTYGDLLRVQPWNNTFDVVELRGEHILEALELSATKRGTSGFMHWSGLRVTYDMSRPVNQRVTHVTLLCRVCRVPEFKPLELGAWYRVVMNSYLVDGDDGYSVFTLNYRNREKGRLDMDVVVDYMKRKGPVVAGLDGRLALLNTGT